MLEYKKIFYKKTVWLFDIQYTLAISFLILITFSTETSSLYCHTGSQAIAAQHLESSVESMGKQKGQRVRGKGLSMSHHSWIYFWSQRASGKGQECEDMIDSENPSFGSWPWVIIGVEVFVCLSSPSIVLLPIILLPSCLLLVVDTANVNIGFLNNLIMFPCKHCPEQFTALSARGLTQHHRKCQAFLKHEAAINQHRKTTVASSKIRQTKLRVKLKDHKAHLGSAAPGVSFFDNR